MAKSKLTLIIPGLLQAPQPIQCLPADDKPTFKTLDLFFKRARRTDYPVKGYYSTLFHEFGIHPQTDADLPVAALTRLIDSGESSEWDLRCDPAYIHPDMDRAVLMGHADMGLTESETEQLLLILNSHVGQDGWQIEAHAVERWYVKGTDKRQLQTSVPHEVLGQDIRNALPRGHDGTYWCSFMNECQMLLHDLPVNLERQARGLLPVNSLWFWGAGQLPENSHCPYDRVFADDILVEGLSRHNACPFDAVSELWSVQSNVEHHHYLLVINDLLASDVQHDLFSWLEGIKQLEQQLFAKLLHMLRSKQLSEIRLLTANGDCFELTASLLKRWWRRQPNFLSLLEKKQD